MFAAGDASITDLGLVVLKAPVSAIEPADIAPPGMLERWQIVRDPMTFVGYGFASRAADGGLNPLSAWLGVRHFGSSRLDAVLNETWAAWSLPGLVCQGDSGGPTFVDADQNGDPTHDKLVAIASDGRLSSRRSGASRCSLQQLASMACWRIACHSAGRSWRFASCSARRRRACCGWYSATRCGKRAPA